MSGKQNKLYQWTVTYYFGTKDFVSHLGSMASPEEVKMLLNKLQEAKGPIEGVRDLEKKLDYMYHTFESLGEKNSIPIYNPNGELVVVDIIKYKKVLTLEEGRKIFSDPRGEKEAIADYFSSKYGLPKRIAKFVFVLDDKEREEMLKSLEAKVTHLYIIDESMKNGQKYRI